MRIRVRLMDCTMLESTQLYSYKQVQMVKSAFFLASIFNCFRMNYLMNFNRNHQHFNHFNFKLKKRKHTEVLSVPNPNLTHIRRKSFVGEKFLPQ